MRLEPRAHPPGWLVAAAPVAAVALAMALAAVPLALAGADIAAAYRQMAVASFGSWFALSETLTRATPLILTGLAVAVAFRARLWNIGAEGQLYLGAVTAVALGTGAVAAPASLLVPLVLAGSALAGALFMLGPTWLKLRLGVDEVVTTLLLNFVALLIVGMLLEGPMQDPMSLGWPQSAPILADATLPRLVAQDPRPCRPDRGTRRRSPGLALPRADRLGLRDPRGRPQRAGRRLRRHAGRPRSCCAPA